MLNHLLIFDMIHKKQGLIVATIENQYSKTVQTNLLLKYIVLITFAKPQTLEQSLRLVFFWQ